MEFIKNQSWRYATKKFNPDKKVSVEHLSFLKQAIQLSASSYGLQLYRVLIIEDKTIREQLKPVSWEQPQIVDASHLFVFCNYANVTPENVDDYLGLTSMTRKLELADLQEYGDFMKMKLSEKSEEELFHWTKYQTYIALANLLSACAELKIDACPMEGFQANGYNKILGLPEKGLNASVLATVGYRSQEDVTQYLPKVRKSTEALFVEV